MKKITTTAVTLAAAGALALVVAPAANALPAGCIAQPWGFLGSQTRAMCDGPLRPDGSWTRHRIIGVDSYYRNATSRCTSGSYSSSCTYYPAGWVEAKIFSDETYVVTPETVLPDEPGWIAH
ncbi:membrane protein [Mycobacterium phage Aminay]|uniref:Membrane protein n=1 Tax=Mycobacterium phage Aminay TaxID=2250291 RepID=A0A345KV64_9CAUD|nr:membrane protein [Mycobacterium phage Aminay]AXH46916.1 membrane protein [Mycobacterium phage Aminay]